MTVGELVKLLSAFDQDLPVLVDGYEGGYQFPQDPRQIIAERYTPKNKSPGDGMFGDWGDPNDSRSSRVIYEPPCQAVLLSRFNP